MKRPLYYLLCAIACTSMVSATMLMAAIAEAMQPQETAGQQAQAENDTNRHTNCRHKQYRSNRRFSTETELEVLFII